MNLTNSLLKDIAVFNKYDLTNLEEWLTDIETAADLINESGDVVTKWIVHGTLNVQVMGLNLSVVSWICKILRQDVNSMHASPY